MIKFEQVFGMRNAIKIFAFVCITCTACTSQQEVTSSSSPDVHLSSLYNPSKISLHPDFSIYHESEQFSKLYIRVYPSEFMFNQTNQDTELRAYLRLKYELIQLEGQTMQGIQIDSASVTYRLSASDKNKSAFLASLNIPMKPGFQYLMDIKTQDLNRGSIGRDYIFIDKTSPYGAQYFKLISQKNGYPRFMRFFNSGESFYMNHSDQRYDTIYVDYFRAGSELPRPPISATSDYTFQHTPDTSFVLPLLDTIDYRLADKGMYFVSVDSERRKGLTLNNFGESFPAITSEIEMLEPIFYLATLAEYRDLRKEPNLKLAVDNFWLKRGNSVEKSRELIRVYYNRVLYSNLYFTSFREGWKTDMGMIFILFGPPSRIQMTEATERWYYFSRRKGKTIEFLFDRQQSKYS